MLFFVIAAISAWFLSIIWEKETMLGTIVTGTLFVLGLVLSGVVVICYWYQL